MSDPKYGHPYPARPPQGHYQGPPVMAPPQYGAPPPQYGAPPPQYGAPPPLYVDPPQQPQKQVGFLEGCLAALCCCCLLDECCCDPSIICIG